MTSATDVSHRNIIITWLYEWIIQYDNDWNLPHAPLNYNYIELNVLSSSFVILHYFSSKVVGWRDVSRRIIVYSSNSQFHLAGSGKVLILLDLFENDF